MTRRWIGLTIVSSVLLLLFLTFKVIRFQSLYYTYNDMYAFLQLSCSWIDGRPVLYENVWGYDDRIHNNYAMLLWGPLIYVLGAYGAFIVLIGLYLLSYTLLLRELSRRNTGWFAWVALAVMLFGPVWFWFNDHPGFGWHPELTYYPLAILFVLALFDGRTGWFLLTAALIVLVKEDGALMAGGIHLAYVCVQYVHRTTQSVFGILTRRRFWFIVGGWALVFVAGMLFLSYKNNAAEPEPRLQQALQIIREGIYQADFVARNLRLLLNNLLLLLPSFLLLLYVLYRTGFRQVGSLLLIYAVAQGALLASNWVQGSHYYGTNPAFDLVSLTWPPRFVLMYAFSVCYVAMVWLVFEDEVTPAPTWQPVALAAGLFIIQLPIVHVARSDFRLGTILHDTFMYRFDPQKMPLLPDSDVAVVERLAKAIPARSSVYVFDFLIPFFHKHYNIWPTDKQWEKANLAIIPNDDFQRLGDRLPRVMKQPYRAVRLNTYTIYVTPAYETYLKQALP